MIQKRFLKLISTLLSLVLLFQLLPMQIFAAESQSESTASMQEATEAYVVAELTEERTAYSKTFRLSNGLHMATVYTEPVHYEKDGEWAEIDLGAATAIKQIDIYFERSDAEQNILSYQVEFYANGAYTTVYTKSEKALQHECIVLEEAEPAEKVKITILDADGGTMGWVNVGIVEVELYGDTHTEELPANANIALGRPATASNVEGGTSFTADKAVDGSTAASSRWVIFLFS